MRVVLLGSGGTGTSFAIASRLKANWGNDVRLIVTDIFEKKLVSTSLLADVFYKVPYAKDPSFSKVLIDILKTEGVQTYIPILNDEIKLAAELKKDQQLSGVDFWSSETYALCTDKLFADEWLNTIGVRTPRRINLADLGGDSGPWFSKPRSGFGSSGAEVLTLDQLRAMNRDAASDLLIQELCSFPEVTVDSFYDAATNVGYAYCRERLETKSGVCTKTRLFADPELSDIASKIGQSLGQQGTICFQVMKSKDGWAVTDLNLRSGAGTALTCAAGYDVISAAFACRNAEDYSKFIKPIGDSEEYFITRQYAEFVMEHNL